MATRLLLADRCSPPACCSLVRCSLLA